jgi:methylated-DNA-protein-cysteine methyltransferase-like protein
MRKNGEPSTGDGFFSRAYEVVRQIPRGRVATYGQVARVMGEPRKARFVGFAMHASPGMAGGVPCHRVVFADGRLAPGFAFGGPGAQRRLLEGEGVSFRGDGTVDLDRCQWEVGS